MSRSKFSNGDTAWYNGQRVKIVSISRSLSAGTANGNLYYRVRRPNSKEPSRAVRSDRLDH